MFLRSEKSDLLQDERSEVPLDSKGETLDKCSPCVYIITNGK